MLRTKKTQITAESLQKCVPDITEIPAKDGKLYVSAIFDCCDLLPVGLAVFHELLEQPQDLLVHWRASSCCKAAKILHSGCRRTLRFIILLEMQKEQAQADILQKLSSSGEELNIDG